MLPLGATRFAVECSSSVKDCSRRRASERAVHTNFAQDFESRNATGFTSMEDGYSAVSLAAHSCEPLLEGAHHFKERT